MRSKNSSVVGWLEPARGTWSRKFSSVIDSMTVTAMSCCAKASARHRPTGPAPTTTTGSGFAIAALFRGGGLLGRYHVLHRAGPALVGQIEHQAGRRLVFRLVERIR